MPQALTISKVIGSKINRLLSVVSILRAGLLPHEEAPCFGKSQCPWSYLRHLSHPGPVAAWCMWDGKGVPISTMEMDSSLWLFLLQKPGAQDEKRGRLGTWSTGTVQIFQGYSPGSQGLGYREVWYQNWNKEYNWSQDILHSKTWGRDRESQSFN